MLVIACAICKQADNLSMNIPFRELFVDDPQDKLYISKYALRVGELLLSSGNPVPYDYKIDDKTMTELMDSYVFLTTEDGIYTLQKFEEVSDKPKENYADER